MKIDRENAYPVVFESCKLVYGYTRTLFCDIQRKSYRFIPNELYNLLAKSRGKTVSEIKKMYNNQYDDIIYDNLSLLEQEEFIFFTDHPEWFPPMSLEWDEPTILTNAIIDTDQNHLPDFNLLWNQLSDLGCEHIQIRFYNKIKLKELEKIINIIGTLRIISLEILVPYDSENTDQEYIDFVYRQPRIFSLTLHTAKENKTVFKSPTEMGHIFYSKDIITTEKQCGIIRKVLFNIHIKSFTEAHHHNTCLNRKISIDVTGNIKNCPSMNESFGNIKDTTLAEAIEKPGFKKYWNIKKDEITKCKDCEFRYICTDCRAFLEDPNDNYSAPLKYGYDPFTGEWSEWSENPLKRKAIEFYGLEDLVKSNGKD